MSVIILVLVAIAAYRYSTSKKGSNIETIKVERGTVQNELVLSGQVNADEFAKLAFPTSGQIAWVGVSEGDSVTKGKALVKLDTTVLNTTFQQARASLRAAEATVEYVHDELKDHAGDETYAQKDTRTTAEVAKDKAYEAYVAAEYNLRNSTLVAPFTGVVTYLAHTFSGENVLATELQAEIINPDTIYYDVSADQTEVTSIHVGQKVNIVFDSYPNEIFPGEVSFISYTPKEGEIGSVYKVKVSFSEKFDDLKKVRIGMSGDAKFVVSEKSDVLYVPPKFVKSDINGKYVNKSGKNNKVYITVGVEGEDRVEISGDIDEGDTLYD